eukprot:TRINITY_DN26549_c0_g1_i1.p1 TRINITY_DN26549_c0_g1~~TRINITY_DN26549_c0_g1_i1.p1  ORF type:complete len:274 (+),score=63.33 TRINITY_DN26549_c0_g1_i1:52-822(+)
MEEENRKLKVKLASVMKELDKRNARSYSPPPSRVSSKTERQAVADAKRLRSELLNTQRKLTLASTEINKLKSTLTEVKTTHDQQLIAVRSANVAAVNEKEREVKSEVAELKRKLKELENSGRELEGEREAWVAAKNSLLDALSKLGIEPEDPNSLQYLVERLVEESIKPRQMPTHHHLTVAYTHTHTHTHTRRSASPYLPDDDTDSFSRSGSEATTLPISHRSPPPPVRGSSLPTWPRSTSRESTSPPSWLLRTST